MFVSKIVVIEDEFDIQDVFEYNLICEGFDVCIVSIGSEGFCVVVVECFDFVFFDFMIFEIDGFDVCCMFKGEVEIKDILIIMVMVKSEESDVVFGFGFGVDDYVQKFFSLCEFVVCVCVVFCCGGLKKVEFVSQCVCCGLVEVDFFFYCVFFDGKCFFLMLIEFWLLYFMVLYLGCVYMCDQFIFKVIGEYVVVVDCNIDVYICLLCKKFGVYCNFIEMVCGVGYCVWEFENQELE